jgi:hypothetical protein
VYNYNAYNLGICSALLLPELPISAETRADVLILLGRVDWSPPPRAIGEEEPCFEIWLGNAYFSWAQLGMFAFEMEERSLSTPTRGLRSECCSCPVGNTLSRFTSSAATWYYTPDYMATASRKPYQKTRT